jgi:hypothetical protein
LSLTNKNNGKLHGGRNMLAYKLQTKFRAILSVKLSRANKGGQVEIKQATCISVYNQLVSISLQITVQKIIFVL